MDLFNVLLYGDESSQLVMYCYHDEKKDVFKVKIKEVFLKEEHGEVLADKFTENIVMESVSYDDCLRRLKNQLADIFKDKYYLPTNKWVKSGTYTAQELMMLLRKNRKYPDMQEWILDLLTEENNAISG